MPDVIPGVPCMEGWLQSAVRARLARKGPGGHRRLGGCFVYETHMRARASPVALRTPATRAPGGPGTREGVDDVEGGPESHPSP